MLWLGNPVRACPRTRCGPVSPTVRKSLPHQQRQRAARGPRMERIDRRNWLAVGHQRRAGRPGGELLPTLRVQNYHRRAASLFRWPFNRGTCVGGRGRGCPDAGSIRVLSLSALQGPTCSFVALNRSTTDIFRLGDPCDSCDGVSRFVRRRWACSGTSAACKSGRAEPSTTSNSATAAATKVMPYPKSTPAKCTAPTRDRWAPTQVSRLRKAFR